MAERFAPVNPLAAGNRQYYRDAMAKDNKAERLAAALRENLKRRKAQARILPGTGRGTAPTSAGAVEGAPSVSPDGLPPPRSGEDQEKKDPTQPAKE